MAPSQSTSEIRRQSVASHVTTVAIQSLLRMSSRKCSKESAPIRTRTVVRDEQPLLPPTIMSLIWNCTGEGRRGRNCECYISIFRLSVSGRCCLDGYSTHQSIFCCSSHSPDASPHPVLHILLPRSLWPSSVSLAFHFLY